jgi:hypothetical protein
MPEITSDLLQNISAALDHGELRRYNPKIMNALARTKHPQELTPASLKGSHGPLVTDFRNVPKKVKIFVF